MNPVVSKIILIACCLAGICVTAYRPDWMSDQNEFLKEFVNHEYLNILGVILAITLASLSQLHLSLRRVEKSHNVSLEDVRAEIKSSAIFLILGFLVGLILVVCKPLIIFGISGGSLVNSACMVILIFYILVLSDITLSVFDLDYGDSDDDT